MQVASFLRRIILSSMACLALPHSPTLSRIIFGKKLLNIKRVLILPATDAWKISHTRSFRRYIIINVYRPSCKVPVTLCRILIKTESSRQLFEKSWNIKFHENSPSGSRNVTWGQTNRLNYESLSGIMQTPLKVTFVKSDVHTGRNMRVTAFWDHAMNCKIRVRFSAELKRPRREVDHLYPVWRFRNTRSYTSIPLTCLHDVHFTFLPLRSSWMWRRVDGKHFGGTCCVDISLPTLAHPWKHDTLTTESVPEAVVYSKGNLPNHHDVSTSLAFKRMSSLAWVLDSIRDRKPLPSLSAY